MSNISIGLNGNNDIYIGADGNLVIVVAESAVAQDCRCAMQAQLGEMIFQPNDGLPNLTDVWLQKNLIKWEVAARNALNNVPGVLNVISLTYTIADDILQYTATIQTSYSSELAINGNITGVST